MGQILHALIEHSLTIEDILEIPQRLRNLSDERLNGNWYWSCLNMNAAILKANWTKNTDYFLPNYWSEEDLNLLVKETSTLDFFSPEFIIFDNTRSWSYYTTDEALRNEFNQLTKAIAQIVSATDLILLPDLSSVPFFDESIKTIKAYREKAKGNAMYAIDLLN